MLACLLPVCSKKAHDKEVVEQEGRATAEPSKHGTSFFTCQFKQMAARLAGGSLSKYCATACVTAARDDLHDDNQASQPGACEMHSPQFSLKSYQMNGHTPTRQDSHENPFGTAEVSPKALRSLQKTFAEAAPAKDEEARTDHGASGFQVYSKEWVAQVEPGVYIAFYTAPDGFNDLKRIKFSRQLFSKQHAENWWTENCSRVRTLYNVRPPSSTSTDDDRFSSGYATPDAYNKSPCSSFIGGDYIITRRKSSADARLKEEDRPNAVTSEEISNSWVEQDEAGVYLTIITVPGVGKQLKRVRFSREKFSEREAAAWWEENRQRIYAQYIFTNTMMQGK